MLIKLLWPAIVRPAHLNIKERGRKKIVFPQLNCLHKTNK